MNEFKVRKGLVINGSGSALLDVQGSVGQLTTITDSLSGSLFSVNDVSGIPVMEAFSDGRVKIGTFGNEAIKISGSFATTTGSLRGTASYVDTSSFSLSSSYALSSSFAFLANTASYVATSSYAISASYASNFNAGYARTFAQVSPSVTWSFSHNLNSFVPLIQVYDLAYNQLIPATIVNTSLNGSSIYFANAQAGYAVISTGGITITGSNAILSQTTPATTWSFYHGLNTQFPVFTVFDSNNNVMMPLQINATNANSASIYFSTPQTGTAVAANCGLSGSGFVSAQTASYVNPLNQTVIITGSLIVSGSGTFRNIGPAAFTGSTAISGALNVIGDVTGSNFLTTGTITAQTLVVQTVTSSISFVTGSTKFGSLAANTHQFTGSVLVSGSIGIGITPSSTQSPLLQVYNPSAATRIRLQYYSGSAGAVDFYSGSTEQWSIVVDSNQTYGKIENRFLATDAIRFYNSTNNVSLNPTSGNTGIGTPSPTARLHVSGATSVFNMLLENANTSAYSVYQAKTGNSSLWQWGAWNDNSYRVGVSGVGDYLIISSSGNIGISTTTPLQPLQLGQVSVISQDANSMYVGANFGSGTGGNYIKSQYANQIHFDSALGLMNFKVAGSGTANNAISYTTAMVITSTGNVGIGLSSPASKLHISQSTASDVYLETGTAGTSGKLIFKTSDNSDVAKYIAQESYFMVFSGNSNEGFKFRDSSSTI